MNLGPFQIFLMELMAKAVNSLPSRQLHVQSERKRHQNDANGVVLVSLLLTLNIFHALFKCLYC